MIDTMVVAAELAMSKSYSAAPSLFRGLMAHRIFPLAPCCMDQVLSTLAVLVVVAPPVLGRLGQQLEQWLGQRLE
jgi:hypothetical protein